MTPRIERYRNLRTIRKITGEYPRRLTNAATINFLDSYELDRATGYPSDTAVHRAYDVAFAVMRGQQ